jgi:uncharacterized protein (TIGR03084 family)
MPMTVTKSSLPARLAQQPAWGVGSPAMAVDVHVLAADLAAEQEALDDVVSELGEDQWALATPSPGWTVADQIGHLTYFDGTASVAIEDPERFLAERDAMVQRAIAGEGTMDDVTLGAARAMSAAQLHQGWRANRQRLAAAAATLTGGERVPWYGPPMSGPSFLTARLMECWAHGQDVVDAALDAGIPVQRPATNRLRHIAQLGFITRGWSYKIRGMEAPEADVRLELQGPSGDTWTWGPDDAAESIVGPAEHFCLVVTQRRHPHDTDLVADGDAARDWLIHAQAFAGGATDGPQPRQ